MNYLDFELFIGPGDGSEYSIKIIHAAAGGEPSIRATLPVGDLALQHQLGELTEARSAQVALRRAAPSTRHTEHPPPTEINESDLARAIGRQLFETLIVGTIRDAYVSSLAEARQQNVGLRLRLSIEPPEVAALPWEFLYDPQEGDHVCLLRETPLTRYTALARDREALTVKLPLRILGMVSAPSDMLQLDVAQEQARIEYALEHRLERGDVEIHWVENGTWRGLQDALDQGPWHVFHFIGHGSFDSTSGEGQLILCREGGRAQFMSATQLGRLFSGHNSLQLAFLNACEGGRTSSGELFSSVGAVLTRRGISAVISMQFKITDQAAIEFSRLFYDGLARDKPVDVAVTEARTGVSFTKPDSIEWATPMLHMHAPDGQLFSVDNGASIFDESKPIPRPIVSDVQSNTDAERPARTDLDQNGQRGLAILQRKVQQYWVEGVLENSLFMQMLHDLDLERIDSAVVNPWQTHLERPGQPSQPLALGQSLVEVFDDYGGSLLILGEPGAGKTTMMLDLTRTLLARIGSHESLSSDVPIVFNLSSWSPRFPLLEDWLADQMSLHYQIPRVNGRSLLAAGAILPLLDGLDETDETVRLQCIEAINGYVLDRSLAGLVVCCRLKEYSDLSGRLALNTAVRLTELTDEQVNDYLNAAGTQLIGLRALLHRETAMRLDARSPLWLNLMVQAYQGFSEIDLANEGQQTAASRRRQLTDAYITRMFRRARGGN